MTPWFPNGWLHYAVGGLLIGSGVALLYILTGLIVGMSTVFSSTWSYVSNNPFFRQPRFMTTRAWRLVFALGLIVGAALWTLTLNHGTSMHTTIPAWRLLVGGLLVGYGSRLANGCTSGHGICGLGSLQLPSLYAVLTFMATAFCTAYLVKQWL